MLCWVWDRPAGTECFFDPVRWQASDQTVRLPQLAHRFQWIESYHSFEILAPRMKLNHWFVVCLHGCDYDNSSEAYLGVYPVSIQRFR